MKEPAIVHVFVGWIEDWEKEKCQKDGAVNKVLFTNKNKNLHFVLPDTGHMYFTCEEEIVFRRHYGWIIYKQCDVPGVEEDEVTVFLAVTLINKTPQPDRVKVLRPKPGSHNDRV